MIIHLPILTSFANIPPILLNAGICIPYLSNSCLIALISSSIKIQIHTLALYFSYYAFLVISGQCLLEPHCQNTCFGRIPDLTRSPLQTALG